MISFCIAPDICSSIEIPETIKSIPIVYLDDKLFANKDTIETQLGIKLEWQRECSGNVSSVKYKLPGLDYDNHSNYDELINKSIDIAANMQKVFKKYI